MLKTRVTQLVALELWLVGILLAGSIVSERILPLTVGTAAGIWLLRWAVYRRRGRATPVDWAIGGLILCLPCNLWISALPAKTWPQLLRLLSGIAIYYALVNWASTKHQLRSLIYGAGGSGLLLIPIGIFSTKWIFNKLSFIPTALYAKLPQNIGSDPIHPNVLAGSLLILLPPIMAYALWNRKTLNLWEKIFFGSSSFLIIATLGITQSRGGLIGLVVVLGLIVTLRYRRGWIVWLLELIILLILIGSLGITQFVNLISPTSSVVNSTNVRVEIWSRALFMIHDFPLTGVGMGLYGDITDSLYPFVVTAPGSAPHAHNLFLQIAVDLGIPALIAWLAIFFLMGYISYQIYQWGQTHQDDWMAGLGCGLFCSQVALAVHGLFDAVTWGMVRPAPLVWGLWGLTAAAYNLIQHWPTDPPTPSK